MLGFRERIGLVSARSVIQTEELDDETRIQLWNTIHRIVSGLDGARMYGDPDKVSAIAKRLWANVFGYPADEYSSPEYTMLQVKKRILKDEWSFALEMVEGFGLAAGPAFGKSPMPEGYSAVMNEVFSKYLVGYRFVAGEILPVIDPAEVHSIEAAVDAGGLPATHLQRAVQLLSNREAPQYANVVHESIHAVEARIAALTGKNVLSEGLKALEAAGYPIHSALAVGWTKLYGYSSDAGGIRHALVRDEEIDEPLALYFLISCSAFVNFLSKVEASRN